MNTEYCKSEWGEEKTKAYFPSLCLQGVLGESVWVICAKMCDSKAYSLTKRQLISAQWKISRSVLIRVSEKFEISPAQHEQTEKHRAGGTFHKCSALQNYSML